VAPLLRPSTLATLDMGNDLEFLTSPDPSVSTGVTKRRLSTGWSFMRLTAPPTAALESNTTNGTYSRPTVRDVALSGTSKQMIQLRRTALHWPTNQTTSTRRCISAYRASMKR